MTRVLTRRRSCPLPSGIGLALLVLLGSSTAAQAEKKAVLLPFTGPNGPGIERALEAAIDEDNRVMAIPADRFFATARDLGLDESRVQRDPTLLSQAAAATQVDAVLRGAVDPKGLSIEITVIDGGTGNELRRLTVNLMRGRLPAAELQRTAQRLVPAIEGGQWMGQVPPELPRLPGGDADEPRGPRIVTPPPAPPLPPPTPTTPRVSPPPPRDETLALRPPRDEFADEHDLDDDSWSRGRSSRAPASAGLVEPPPEDVPGDGLGLALLGGPVFLSRTFELENVRLADGRAGTVSYESGLYPGAWIEAQLYPLQLLGERGWLAGIGLEASFDYGILESEVQEQVSEVGTTEQVNRTETTTQYQLGSFLTYRLAPFAITYDPVLFKIRIGLGLTKFALETGTPGYQSNQTLGMRLGLGFDVPFVEVEDMVFTFIGSGDYLVGSTALNEKKRYPGSPARGFDVLAGLRLVYARSLLFQVSYFLQSYETELQKTSSEPAATGKDLYMGPLILIGYGI